MEDIEIEEGYVLDMNGDEQLEEDCVKLHDETWCHADDAVMNESDGEYYHCNDDGLGWCQTNECYFSDSEMIYGEVYEGGEGWFHQDTDYCYSEHSDRYFQCADTANNCDYGYSESRDDYIPNDEMNNDNENWDSTGITSDTMFTETYGMPYTFGVEMETCDGYLDYTSKYNLKCVDDGSIEAQEYVTGILQGNKGMIELDNICQALSSHCYVDKTCGVHVHIGGANFNRRFAILSIMLGQMMQTQLFRIQPKSRRTNTYCKEIPEKYRDLRTINKKEFPFTYKRMLRLLSEYIAGSTDGFNANNCKKSSNPGGHYSSTRYKWLNLNNFSYRDRGETIEFRQHSGSLDYHKIRKWLLFCMSFVKFVENHSRTIIETYNKFQEDPAVCISMREVLVAGLGKEGDNIADYYDKREERFN